MENATNEKRIRAVLLYIDGVREAKEIYAIYGIPVRTFRRWVSTYRQGGLDIISSQRDQDQPMEPTPFQKIANTTIGERVKLSAGRLQLKSTITGDTSSCQGSSIDQSM